MGAALTLADARALAASPRYSSQAEYLRALLVVALAVHDAVVSAEPSGVADPEAKPATRRRKG